MGGECVFSLLVKEFQSIINFGVVISEGFRDHSWSLSIPKFEWGLGAIHMRSVVVYKFCFFECLNPRCWVVNAENR